MKKVVVPCLAIAIYVSPQVCPADQQNFNTTHTYTSYSQYTAE